MNDTRKLSWMAALHVYLEPASWRMLCLGFSAGLPLLLVLGTLSFRLREAGIDRSTIGFLSWVGLAYGFKWVWSPLVDRLPLPLLTRWLGRRRSWLLLAQAMVVAGLIGMALLDPQLALEPVVWYALVVAFGSATQHIALDTFRIDSADAQHQAALAATYQTGYRLAMIWAGAGVLWVAARASGADETAYQHTAWQTAYLVMAASMSLGVLTVLLSPEPAQRDMPPARNAREWLQSALVEPFAEFIRRYRWQAALILGLIAVYRISDVVMAFIGGVLSMRLGVMRILMLGAVLSALTNLLFAWLATRGHDLTALVWVISADNLASGIASAAFIAYLSSLTNVNYSATQYALFSSMMLLAPKWLAGFSGVYVDAHGYETFFNSTALLGAPVLLLVWLASRILPVAHADADADADAKATH